MKVIFLDCDGVLNYTKYYSTGQSNGNLNGEKDIDPKCVDRVIQICKETGAKIVVSSDWRISWPGAKIRLERGGFTEGLIIGKTPEFIWRRFSSAKNCYENEDLDDCSRGAEIADWLKNNPECTNYLILDDRADFTEEQQPHFIYVDPMYGLTDDHIKIGIQILNHH